MRPVPVVFGGLGLLVFYLRAAYALLTYCLRTANTLFMPVRQVMRFKTSTQKFYDLRMSYIKPWKVCGVMDAWRCTPTLSLKYGMFGSHGR